MGININWSNKHERDIRIKEIEGRVNMNASNNDRYIVKHTNTTNLIGTIAKGVLSLASTILGGANKDSE